MWGDRMKCECGKTITKKRDLENNKIAKETKTPKLDMCAECWVAYCEHALMGE